MANEAVIILAEFECKEGREAEFEKLLGELRESVLANEADTQLYELTKEMKKPKGGVVSYTMIEFYKSKAALKTHSESSAFKKNFPKVLECLANPKPNLRLMKPVSTKIVSKL